MKILVFSDTHGKLSQAKAVIDRTKDIDLIVHLGDYLKDGIALGEYAGVDCYAVRGNMDGSTYQNHEFLEVECGTILLTHGHMDNVKYDPTLLAEAAKEEGCKGAFFGHTHMAFYEEIDGIKLLNPGSISNPRGGNKGSYGVVNTDEKSIECTILYYTQGGPKKPQGGYLRSLMNYSDGF